MLTEDERAMLDLESQRWRFGGAKESAIAERFGISATRYYMRLNVLLERPEAIEYAPVVANRLLRMRESARRG